LAVLRSPLPMMRILDVVIAAVAGERYE
jgi:hypothetical protein